MTGKQQNEPQNKPPNRKQNLSFALSLAIHIIFALILIFLPKTSLHRPRTVEVELVDADKLLRQMKDDSMNGQIVDQDEKALNNELVKDAKYLSRHNQRVAQETQAELHGKFSNSSGAGGPKAQEKIAAQTATAPEVAKNSKKMMTSENGIPFNGKKPTVRDMLPNFKMAPPKEANEQQVAQGGGAQPSANDDNIKDVKTGAQTLLSTREFVYFSYYNRIKEKLRQYWEPKIKEKMERILRQGRSIASSGDKITRIIIILDEKGVLQKVQVVGASGVSDLDDAAVEAFRAAAPFPNPPKGIVEADGTIKIHWDFILEAANWTPPCLHQV